MDDNNRLNDEQFLKKVEEAARKGAGKGKLNSFLIQALLILLAVGGAVYFINTKVNTFNEKLESVFHFEDPAESHDLVLENNGIFGYTAADFEEAVLGDSQKQKKLQVMTQEVSDVSTVTEAGLLNWSVFTKNQLITYNGTAVYTVDLSEIGRSDISFNEEEKTVTLKIPHAVREEINIPEDKIQFGDTTGGLLAFGDLHMTPEEISEVQAGARKKMEQKLEEDHVIDQADRFAKLVVWELYSPIIKGVGKDVSLVVEFR
ncbi:MAG: DUF4230 domain-containing protein [Erysipelotrichaceae bacterium]|nr:DUF4230 domain-containing protein [Erysipelotrichaceae bacterium]